ncbi:MAG: trypsin-like serine protease [Spirulinaceae cyanobacterium SM2_1_0]|nr:trypsin-like serine protease [Spirulinaceae cyanobacterium SM2_1_0]
MPLVLLPALVLAGEPEVAGPPQSPVIWGGSEAEPCSWPSVVLVTSEGSLCTGTLIHPKVVLYAAHCGDSEKSIHFGDSKEVNRTVPVEYCQINPDNKGLPHFDWAYCVLKDEVTEIPFTPVGYGCEIEQYLYEGQEIEIVGFGDDLGETGSGRKRWGISKIVHMADGHTFSAGNGAATVCSGDSGGPAFIRYPDGSWHTFGITVGKFSETCDHFNAYYSAAHNAAEWVEEHSGIDVTVCHDIDGNWDPSYLCGRFYDGEPELGYGAWRTWCEDATESGWSDTCGPDFGNNVEADAPELAIVAPSEGASFGDEPTLLDIEIAVADASGFWVHLEIIPTGGDAVSTPVISNESPTVFSEVAFFSGEYTLVAYATDFWGNQSVSVPVTFTVGELGEDSGDESTDSGEGVDDESTDDPGGDGVDEVGETSDDAPGAEGEAGCSCMNLMMGWEETLGLPKMSFYP